MKEKLTLHDLVDLLSKKTSLSKKEADTFLREFFSLITENVFLYEPVKIKDFGTFKLTRVNSRESVDVNTGEKIEIPAHYKLSFLPDKSLKELVNKPYSHFETTLLEDDVSFDLPEETDENTENLEVEDTADDIQEIEIVQEEIQVEYIETSADNTPEEQPEALSEEVNQPEETTPEEKEKEESPSENQPIEEEGKEEITVSEESSENDILSKELVSESIEDISSDEENNSPFSYVYTSTVSTENKGNTPAITFVVPGTENETEKTTGDISQSTGLEDDENALATPIELNKVQEKIDELKEELKAFRKDCLSSTTKIVQEEKQEQEKIYEDVTREIKEAAGDDLDMLKRLEPVEHPKPKYEAAPVSEEKQSVRQPDFVEVEDEGKDDEPEEEIIEKPVRKYKHSYLWKRMFRYIAFIILLAGILVFGIYKVFKLYENSPEKLAENKVDLSFLNISSEDSDNEGIVNDSAVFSQKEPMGKIISDRLKICVVKKGENQLQTIQQEQPEDVEVYEVVKPGSFLRSISVKHYGKNIFWVYIYEENKDKIADPNNVDIGTVLRIPKLEKYGTSVDDPEALAKAIKVENDIVNNTKRNTRRR